MSGSGSVASRTEAIIADEGWQDHLTADERRVCVEWAERRMFGALSAEATHVRGVLRLLNYIMGSNPLDRLDVIRAVFVDE
jgi:hypothetical protein